jgi:hypothetical protein
LNQTFQRIACRLNQRQVQLLPLWLQDYDPAGDQFDILLLHQSINHMDEHACSQLHRDRAAQALYPPLFLKLAALARPGAKLIAVDCARRNLFPDLRLKNPILRSIEWDKHQSPSCGRDCLVTPASPAP